MPSNQIFATKKPVSLFFAVAIPGCISMLAMSIYSVLEGVFVGQLLGEAAFAAINLAMPFVFINFSLADMIGVGSSVPISIALGRKDNKTANNFFTCAIILIFLAAVLMGTILFTGAPAFVRLMGAEGELAHLAVKYVRIYAAMSPLCTLCFAMDNFLKISGFVKFSMVINVGMSFLTIGLLYSFIKFLNMDVEGAALASSSSMSMATLIALVPFIRKKAVLKFTKPKLTFKMVKEIIACGSPIFLNNIAGRVAAIVMNVALLRVGGQTAVAAYSVLMYANEIIQPLLYGISDSVQPAIGFNWGARKAQRVRDIAKCAFTACAAVSVIGTAVMFLFPQQISELFVKADDNALLEMSVNALRLFSVTFIVRWFGFAVQGFFSAIEKPLPASVLSVSTALILPIAFIFLFSPMGLDGLWLNMAATSLVVSVMAFFMLLNTQKKMREDIKRLAR